MELLQALLLCWSLSLPNLTLAQQTQAQTKCTSSVLNGTAAYNDCCPGVGTSPITLNGRRYKVLCGKEIRMDTTRYSKPNPISCTQACDANPDCITAYWIDTFGGICTLYTAVPPGAGTNSVALVPIQPDDNECNKKIAAAVAQSETRKDQECEGKINTAKTAECQRCQNLKDCPKVDCSTCPTQKCPDCPKVDCPKVNCPKVDCSTCPKNCPRCPKPDCRKDCPPVTKRPSAPRVSGCGAGRIHGPYAGGHYYASYVGCTGQGNFLGAQRISSNQQNMDVCVQMCLRTPGCVMAIREHAASTGMASRCSLKSSRSATFAKGDNDLILKIQ